MNNAPDQFVGGTEPVGTQTSHGSGRFRRESGDGIFGGIMAFDIRRVDLGKLNSMTKYPSILTYHNLGDKGILQETVQIPFEGRVIGTEKVDGTNTR